VLPFYVLHEPVIVAAAWFLVRWHAPVPAKYATLVLVSLAATLALYEAGVRRYRLTRLLFGMKPLKLAGAQGRELAAAAAARHDVTPTKEPQ
jgi:peptidoglycan/LPS O-acetylase OafA/YrhL